MLILRCKVSINKKEKFSPEEAKKKGLTIEEREQIANIIKKVGVNSMKWYFEKAKWLIIEWLAIDKKNIDLNLELANIYEKEKKYEKAEYVYTDMLETKKWDIKILKKLAYVYALQNKLKKSFKTYEEIHKKNVWDDYVIEMLADITFNIWYYERAVKYTTMFLKNKPRNVEKLTMKAVSLEKLKKYLKAIKVHKTILELQPYNTFSRDKVREMENYV